MEYIEKTYGDVTFRYYNNKSVIVLIKGEILMECLADKSGSPAFEQINCNPNTYYANL